MTTYHVLEPEVGGGIGESSVLDYGTRPPKVIHLNYEFIGWLGDDLLTTHPCYIVTDRLAQALKGFQGTGYSIAEMTVSKNEQFDELYPGTELPHFWWLKIDGQAGVDDAGLRPKDQSLVVSDSLLALFSQVQAE